MRMPSSIVRVFALCLGVTVIAAPLPGRAAEPYEINVLLPLTGSASFTGPRSSSRCTPSKTK